MKTVKKKLVGKSIKIKDAPPIKKKNLPPDFITRIGVQCPICKEMVVSLRRHDFTSCDCGAVSVDGGGEYLKICTGSGVAFEQLVKMKVRMANSIVPDPNFIL